MITPPLVGFSLKPTGLPLFWDKSLENFRIFLKKKVILVSYMNRCRGLLMAQVTDLADPRRCQANTHEGQCLNVVLEGDNYCERHSHSKQDLAPRLKQYLLTNQDEAKRIAQLADSDTVKSLRETAAIANRLLELYYNKMKTDSDCLAFGGMIDRQIKTVEKVVKSMVELDERTGSVLSQEQLLGYIRQMVQIIHEELVDVDNYEQIEDRIGERFAILLTKKRPLSLSDESK
jgi:hypothetical protein